MLTIGNSCFRCFCISPPGFYLVVLLLVLAPSLCACHGGAVAPCEACGCCCPRRRLRLGLVDEYQLVQFILGFKGTQPVEAFRGALSHAFRVGGHGPAQGPSTPQIGSQRRCIRE